MAIEFSEAGHDAVLAEKNREVMEEEHWKKVEDAGVEITDKDEEAAKDAEVAILFTPFGKRTYEIGISSLHPAAVPGTPQHGHYVISGKTTSGLK